MEKKLYKSRSGNKVDGVCGGIAKYFGIDVTIVRIVWIILAFSGTGILAYIACSLIMPREPEIADAEPYAGQ